MQHPLSPHPRPGDSSPNHQFTEDDAAFALAGRLRSHTLEPRGPHTLWEGADRGGLWTTHSAAGVAPDLSVANERGKNICHLVVHWFFPVQENFQTQATWRLSKNLHKGCIQCKNTEKTAGLNSLPMFLSYSLVLTLFSAHKVSTLSQAF